MKLNGNTVLVTGGGSGIGLAIAERFLKAGSEVIVCGRRESKLREAVAKGMRTRLCDVGDEKDRVALRDWAFREFPRLNVLVNNAGIQNRLTLADGDWRAAADELTINLAAPIHLSMLFIPKLLEREAPAILNVTSGLSFSPLAAVPVYCATKAAMHSFTLSLRHQLASTPIRVIEIIPPAVDTDLGGPGLHTFGAPLAVYADSVFEQLGQGAAETTYGFSQQMAAIGREQLEQTFQKMNPRDPA
jgi:uncharacterized oxidoreductase